ncbi:MAG: hypothetical protein IH987_01975 [Planctomycetes bacterium]|nr:hypothetical protein [Planctomycetota bacterium]
MLINFTLALTGGMLAILATARWDQIAWKFLRIVTLLVFAMAAVVGVWTGRESMGDFSNAEAASTLVAAGLVAFGALVVVLGAPFASTKSAILRIICAAAGLAGIGGACLLSLASVAGSRDTLQNVMLVLSELLGALLLGSITVSWLLGHAYLTATKMTIAPLRHFSRMTLWAVGLRIAFAVVSLTIAWQVSRDCGIDVWSRIWGSWLILSLRFGVGLIGVGAFAYMVADCVRLRSTQSATGILYFGSIFAYIGELAARQMIAECGWPV